MLSSAATPRPSGTASAGRGGTFEPGIAGTISSPIKTPWGSGQLHGEERPRGALDLLLCDVSDERGFRTEGKRESPRPGGRREAPPQATPWPPDSPHTGDRRTSSLRGRGGTKRFLFLTLQAFLKKGALGCRAAVEKSGAAVILGGRRPGRPLPSARRAENRASPTPVVGLATQ